MAIIRRFFTGNTAQNNAYIGSPGRISFNTENNSVRIHDGTTPGGHEVAELRDIAEALKVIDKTSILSGNINGQEVTFLVDDDYGWCDLTSDISIRNKGSSDPSWENMREGINAYMFAAGRMNECWTSFHIGHDYAMGTKLYPHIHWTPQTAEAGIVRWGIEYTIAKGHGQTSGSVFGPTRTIFIQTTIDNEQHKHFITEASDEQAISSTLAEPDSMILLRVFRDGQNDTFPAGVFNHCVSLHYQVSRTSTRNKSPDFFA